MHLSEKNATKGNSFGIIFIFMQSSTFPKSWGNGVFPLKSMGMAVTPSVGIDLKELGGQMSKCLKFCTGVEILNRFSLKNERL